MFAEPEFFGMVSDIVSSDLPVQILYVLLYLAWV